MDKIDHVTAINLQSDLTKSFGCIVAYMLLGPLLVYNIIQCI